jgi:DNA replication protein DnaC
MHQTIEKMNQLRLHQMAVIHHQRITENIHSDYSVDEYTTLLVDQEWEERQSKKMNRLIQAAKFKVNATMSEIDYQANRGLDRDMISRLALLSFVKQRQNVILSGPAGVGKSYLAQALGHHACLNQCSTLYQITSRFLATLKFGKMDGTYLKHLTKLSKIKLLILDDFGLQKLDHVEREILMDIIEDRHDQASTILASQIPISKWYEIIGEGTIADAILDRIVHSAHRITLTGESLRKKNKPKEV